jgi:hypothetical protein
MNMIKDPDSGIRYWGAVGCFLVNAKPDGIHALLEDESHEVRAMVAWLLIKTGEKEQGFQCLSTLLKENSYATLKVLNIIDWMGDDGKVLMPLVQSLKFEKYEAQMQEDLLLKFGLQKNKKVKRDPS